MTDREKLLKLILEADDICQATDCADGTGCDYCGLSWCCHEMTADHLLANGVVVREKGEWVRMTVDDELTEETYYWYRCPVCGVDEGLQSDFCPNCGADMRKGENG